MKLEIFSPEDFEASFGITRHDATTTYPHLTWKELTERARDAANARINEWLSKNGKPVYSFYGDHWHEQHTPEANNKISHKAWLICEKIIEKCSHPKEKVTNQGQYVDNKVLWHCFICECGARVRPKEFEEIK